jgi:hypothetical protein
MLDYLPTTPVPENSARVKPTLKKSGTGRAPTSKPGHNRPARLARAVLACLPPTAADLGLPTPQRTDPIDAQRLTRTVGAVGARLGDLPRELGHEGARQAFQRAIDSGEPFWAPAAAQAIRDLDDGR